MATTQQPAAHRNPKQPIDPVAVETKLSNTTSFLSGFDPELFIDSLLSEQCDYSIEKGVESFELDPFLTILQDATKKIGKQFQAYQRSVALLQTGVRDDEEVHLQNIASCKQKYDQTLSSFKRTETTVSRESSSVMQAGERLLDLNTETKRAKQALLMLEMFEEFNHITKKDIKRYKPEYPDVDLVLRVKKLKSISSELGVQGYATAIQNIDDFACYLEFIYLEDFKKAIAEKKIDTMRELAEVLDTLDVGEKYVDAYLDNIPLFNDENDVASDEHLADQKDDVAIDKCKINNPCIHTFFKKMVTQITREKREIERVFLQSDAVIARFMQRVFELRINNFLDIHLFQEQRSLAQLLFVFYDAYDQTVNSFVPNLVSSGIDRTILTVLVKKYFDENLGIYLENETLYMQMLFSDFATQYEARKKAAKLDSSSRIVLADLERLLVPDAVQNTMNQLAFATVRVQALLPRQQAPTVLDQLYKFFADFCTNILLDCATRLEMLTLKQPATPAKNAPFQPCFFAMLAAICRSVSVVQNTFQTSFVPSFRYSLDRLQRYTAAFSRTMQDIEAALARAVVAYRTLLLACAEKLLAYKSEFKLRDESDESYILNQNATHVCQEFCRYVVVSVAAVRVGLTALNRKYFLSELANGLFAVVLKALRKTKITPVSGGFLLMYDMNKVCDTIASCQFPPGTRPQFDALIRLYKLFFVPKNQVIAVFHEIQATKPAGDRLPYEDYLQCRTDYSKDMKV